MDLAAAFDRVTDRLGIGELTNATELTGGSSASVYRLDFSSGTGADVQSVVFRKHRSTDFFGRDKDVTETEFAVLSELHASGFPVAKPLALEAAEAWLVTDWIEGIATVAPAQLDAALDQMAAFLAELHQLDPATLPVEQLPTIEDPYTGVLAHLPDSLLGRKVASQLAHASPTGQENQRRLIHGDYWPGNVLWDNGQLAAVIDWEDSKLGDPLADLACARVELLCEYGAEAMGTFTNSYLQRNDLSLQALSMWEVYVSAAALASMHLWNLDPTNEVHRRRMTSQFFERAAAEFIARAM